jgi:CRISPR/Cas system-associated exonuclease Cas4 (RecB family)
MITKLIKDVQAKSKRLDKMESDILKAVDALDNPGPARFPLSPSSALKSKRDLFYALKNYYAPGTIPTDALEPKVKLTFEIGHMVEAMMVKYFKEAYQLKDEQRRVTFGKLTGLKEVELTGSIDWAVKINGETILMDCKSINSYGFTLLHPRNQVPAPKDDNIAQMQLYMHSDWGRKNNVNKAILVYFNKDKSELRCIEVSYDENLAKAILERFQEVWTLYHVDILPEREYVLGCDWQALYNNFKTHDNAEFAVAPEKRTYLKVDSLAPTDLKEFVLEYGSTVVEFKDKTIYANYSPTKLTLQVLGEKIWQAV